MIAFIGPVDGKLLIIVRSLDSGTNRPLRGTDGLSGSGPFFWSPDSQSIPFFERNRLEEVTVSGGPPQTVATLPEQSSGPGRVESAGVILVGSGQTGGGLLQVAADSGRFTPASRLDSSRKERFHTLPHFLPDGRHFFFLAVRPMARSAAFVGTLDSNERVALPGVTSEVRYAAGGHVVFLRDGALMTQPFDIRRLALTGEATPVIDSLTAPSDIRGRYSLSSSGTLAYTLSVAGGISQISAGLIAGELSWTGSRPTVCMSIPQLSPDDKLVAYDLDQDQLGCV